MPTEDDTTTAVKVRDEYESLRKKLKEMRKEYQKAGKQLFKKEARALFNLHPLLRDFSWTQYTPYFNDGEPCTFSCYRDDPRVNGDDWWAEDFPGDEKYPAATKGEMKAMQQAVAKFLGAYEEEDMELWFGDHARIVVTKKGITVEQYSHD